MLKYENYSFALCEFFSWSTAAAGNYAFRLDVKHDVSVAPGGVLSLTSNLPPSIYCYVDYASGAPGLGLA